jgi:polyhydroxybutyrate depolymerase
MIVAAVVCLLVLGACGDKPRRVTSAPLQHGELSVGGQVRKYRVFAPATLPSTKLAPLVMVLHGGGNSGEAIAQTTQLDRFASTDEFIAVYPEGLNGYWNGGFCCGSASANDVDDVGFLAALIERLAGEYRIDRTRVSVVGVSNGGIMAYRFACARADLVTAVASVAGAMVVEDCHPTRPVSVMELHGTADPSVPYNGGRVLPRSALAKVPVPSTADVVRRWVDVNGCGPTPTASTVGPVTTSVWSGCGAATSVTLVSIDGGSHTWFAPGLGPSNGAIDATAVITGFLARSGAG